VVSETKQTFVATIYIAARDFSRFPNPFETTAICPRMATVLLPRIKRVKAPAIVASAASNMRMLRCVNGLVALSAA
jgi:hypothetical protein